MVTQSQSENLSLHPLSQPHLLGFVLIQVVLFLLVRQVPPHPSDNLPNLPQLQVWVGCLYLVPYLVCTNTHVHKEEHNTHTRVTKTTDGHYKESVVSTRQKRNRRKKCKELLLKEKISSFKNGNEMGYFWKRQNHQNNINHVNTYTFCFYAAFNVKCPALELEKQVKVKH